jgi:hypothetical protein
MQLSTGYFRSDFVKICDFYIGNAVQFSIRSNPFFDVFLRDLLSKVDMHAYWAITYAYAVALVSIFVPKSRVLSRNAVRFLAVLSRSIRNETRSYVLLCKIVSCMPI